MVTTLITNREFFKNVRQWRVGRSAATHSYIETDSNFTTVEWEENDPYVKLTIPGAADAVYQIIVNPDITGRIVVRDYGGIDKLLYQTNIDASANKAVTSTSRNVIDYFAVQVDAHQVVAATEVSSSITAIIEFNNTRIGRIGKAFNEPASPWVVEFYATSYSIG